MARRPCGRTWLLGRTPAETGSGLGTLQEDGSLVFAVKSRSQKNKAVTCPVTCRKGPCLPLLRVPVLGISLCAQSLKPRRPVKARTRGSIIILRPGRSLFPWAKDFWVGLQRHVGISDSLAPLHQGIRCPQPDSFEEAVLHTFWRRLRGAY